jgi:tetratricopeptide (TPR) repeat protein
VSKEELTSAVTVSEAVAILADKLAFNIISTDPTLATEAITTSWQAFQLFKAGLEQWKHFEIEENFQALRNAIQQFRKAILEDPRFALSHYHLGLALQKGGQPAAAVEAFRASLKVRPNFIANSLALAVTLFNFDRYYYPTPAATPPLRSSEESMRQTRRNEAHRLWQQMLRSSTSVSPLDRAAVYYGLCSEALYESRYALAYFYCKRAEAVYAKLARTLPDDPNIKTSEAAVLHVLGVTLERKQQTVFRVNWLRVLQLALTFCSL